MRLDAAVQSVIKQEALAIFGSGTQVRVFGSRADDAARGGDIDLLIEPAVMPANVVVAECTLSARLQIALGGRKVDVIVNEGAEPVPLIVRLAQAQGVLL